MEIKTVEILVDTSNPDMLDKIVNQFGAALVGGGLPEGYKKINGHYVMRCFGDVGFIKFMLSSQGYGKVIEE